MLLDEPNDVKAGPTDKTPVIGRNAHGSVQVQGGNFSKLYGKLTPSVVREYLSVTHWNVQVSNHGKNSLIFYLRIKWLNTNLWRKSNAFPSPRRLRSLTTFSWFDCRVTFDNVPVKQTVSTAELHHTLCCNLIETGVSFWLFKLKKVKENVGSNIPSTYDISCH